MQLSARLAAIASVVFGLICLWFAVDGFLSLAGIADPEQASSARSFAWFWSFLAFAGAAIGWTTWKVSQAQTDEDA